MIATTTTADLTWRLLWSHTAREIVKNLVRDTDFKMIEAGYGWGLCRSNNARIALLLHPTASNEDGDDLSLTVLGAGTQPLPRAGSSYCDYVRYVEDAVETAARFYLR